jgi:hypothetical protein
MRKGASKRTIHVDPLDPIGDSERPRAPLSGLDAARFAAKRRLVRKQVPPTVQRRGIAVALTVDEYRAELARIDADRELEPPPTTPRPTGLRLPIDGHVPPRHRQTLDEVRRFADETVARRWQPGNIDYLLQSAVEDEVAQSGYDRPTWWTPPVVPVRDVDWLPDTTDNDSWLGPPDDDDEPPLWALDENGQPFQWYQAERADATTFFGEEVHSADDDDEAASVEPVCAHCGIDPIHTKRDGLCRWCKQWKTRNRGRLPDDRAVRRRRERKAI